MPRSRILDAFLASASSNANQASTTKARERQRRPSTAFRSAPTHAVGTAAKIAMRWQTMVFITRVAMALVLNLLAAQVRCSAAGTVLPSTTRRPAVPATKLVAAARNLFARMAAVSARITTRQTAVLTLPRTAFHSLRHLTAVIAAMSAGLARLVPMAIVSAKITRRTAVRMLCRRVTACLRIRCTAVRARLRV